MIYRNQCAVLAKQLSDRKATLILKIKNISVMHHRTTYIHGNFQQNQVSRSVKTVQTTLFAKNGKLHTFSTCN